MSLKDTKRTLRIPQNVCREFEERAVDMDIVLPDYCPDVTAVLKCMMKPTIVSRFQSGDRYTVDGMTTLRILYLAEDRENVYGYEVSQPFSVSFRSSGAIHHCLEVKNDYVNCRAVSPRRMDIHGAFRVFLNATAQGSVEVFADPKTAGIHCKTRPVLSTVPQCETEKSFVVDEAINMGVKIDRLIYADSTITSFETKVLTNKLIVKGTLCLKALYAVDSSTACLKQDIPFSQIVDVAGLSDEWLCNVKMDISECETHLQSGETGGSLLFLNCKIHACVYCSSTEAADVVLDAYSVEYPLLCEMMPLNMVSSGVPVTNRLTLYQNMSLPERTADVVDLWGQLKTCEVKGSENGGQLDCCVSIGFIAKDESGHLGYYERTVDFVSPHDVSAGDVTVSLISLNKHINSDQCRVQAELDIHSDNTQNEILSVVAGTVEDEQNAYRKCASAIRIVYAKPGESVWEIAKYHHSGVEDILAENDLLSEDIDVPTMLMIPIA